MYHPLEVSVATSMVFGVGMNLADFEDVPGQVREDTFWGALARAHGEDEGPDYVYVDTAISSATPPAIGRGDLSLVRYHWDRG